MWLAQQGVPGSPTITVLPHAPAPKAALRKEKNGSAQGRLAITEEVSK
jgi:hypothetical protein